MILLIDNLDSYTYNLFQLIAQVTGEQPLVVAAPDITAQRIPERVGAGEFSHIIISPGPGTVTNTEDFGDTAQVLAAASGTPLLGVCLGFQGLAAQHGATIAPAPQPRHGHLSTLRHSGTGMFTGLAQDLTVVRYHSLQTLNFDPQRLRAHAWSEDGVIMALEVIGEPHWGVQFHPESILTQRGADLIRGFLRTTATQAPTANQRYLHQRVVPGSLDCEATVRALHADPTPHAVFWLDSATASQGNGRFSILGTSQGRLAQILRYRLATGVTDIFTYDGVHQQHTDILTLLEEDLAHQVTVVGAEPVTVPFQGGYVGYLGYEIKELITGPGTHHSDQPDAYWVLPQVWAVYDHQAEHTVVLALTDQPGEPGTAEAHTLFDQLISQLRRLPGSLPTAPSPTKKTVSGSGEETVGETVEKTVERRVPGGSWRLSSEEYQQRIHRIHEELHAGNTYEVCLTDTYETTTGAAGLDLYSTLRATNPAPYSAYLAFRSGGDDLDILCASPERFLTVNPEGVVESKPIKGTAPRSADPVEDELLRRTLQEDAKTQAENLMIVDLLRNDLGRVCQIGTVEVPALMVIESYATVHQMVSTVRGRLRPELGLIDLLRATFPGGSMTGAPKIRTLDLIDTLEPGPRGIYSGALGYLGYNGVADLNIVIRTIVRQGEHVSVGAGGAVVLDSDPVAEDEEKQLKAAALLRTVEAHS